MVSTGEELFVTWPGVLTAAEVEFTKTLLGEFASAAWLRPLAGSFLPVDSLTVASKPLLFELRVAAHLDRRVTDLEYEYLTGVGNSSVDFRFHSGGREWYLELVSVGVSNAVRSVSWDDGFAFGASLSSDAADQRATVQGELILVQQKIGEKVVGAEEPIKFPPPQAGRYHAILADVRGFGLTGGDAWDYREIAYGHRGIPDELAPYRHWWRDTAGAYHPIRGLFEAANTKQRAARLIRERVHFVGFSWDEDYKPGTIGAHTFWCANPHLFGDDQAAWSAFLTLPLRPSDVPPTPDG
jgi:hypothetical protein